MLLNLLASSLLAATSVTASPVSPRSNTLEQVLLTVAPATSSCANEPAAGQCRTASQASGPLQTSFNKYGITTNNEKAAIISLILYETGSLKYNENVFPGRPGQGTRNMQMIPFNVQYAESIIPLTADLAKIAGTSTGINAASLSTKQQNAIRALLTSDDYFDFGSAAWFLSTQCTPDVRAALKTGGVAGWARYITECVGTTVADRQALFDATLLALA